MSKLFYFYLWYFLSALEFWTSDLLNRLGSIGLFYTLIIVSKPNYSILKNFNVNIVYYQSENFGLVTFGEGSLGINLFSHKGFNYILESHSNFYATVISRDNCFQKIQEKISWIKGSKTSEGIFILALDWFPLLHLKKELFSFQIKSKQTWKLWKTWQFCSNFVSYFKMGWNSMYFVSKIVRT